MPDSLAFVRVQQTLSAAAGHAKAAIISTTATSFEIPLINVTLCYPAMSQRDVRSLTVSW
jgi:hypothetical protein